MTLKDLIAVVPCDILVYSSTDELLCFVTDKPDGISRSYESCNIDLVVPSFFASSVDNFGIAVYLSSP